MMLKKSENFKQEYCASIVRVGEVTPIEGSDFLGRTLLNGEPIVVRKDQVKEGDVVFYVSNECQISEFFLSVNNLFEYSCREKNLNYEDTQNLTQEEARGKVGFFNKHGRVRAIRLRGQLSMGYIFGLDELTRVWPNVRGLNLEEMVGVDFDSIGDDLFVKAYVPPMKTQGQPNSHKKKEPKGLDRMVEGQFTFHYDTNPLKKNIHCIKPTDNVVISNKLHGTSAIFSNVKVKYPKVIDPYKPWREDEHHISCFKVLANFVCGLFRKKPFDDFYIDYGNVYSSRSVIKNQYLNPNAGQGFYKTDIWGEWNDVIYPLLPKGMTVYGEIVGYLTGSQQMVQKGYDYGCEEGTSKFMPYRIVTENEGVKYEWNVVDVYGWTLEMLKEHPELEGKLLPLDILYHGTLADRYPEIHTEQHWHENVLVKMEQDFGLEKLEPLCKNKVPREGVCLRVDDDPLAECWKLKANLFLDRERKAIDAGDVDMEMGES